MSPPILQFGTSRFLQAHVDLFVSQARDRGEAGQALGGIAVVQTTGNPASAQRIAALAAGGGYPVRIRGLRDGKPFENQVTCHAIRKAWNAHDDWPAIREAVATDVRVIVSNTADRGWELDERDGPALIGEERQAPRSFPAKLLVLLHHRWRELPAADLSIFPCELVARNGDTLRGVVRSLAARWQLEADFIAWLGEQCVWANSLVDRIVPQALHPVGAVAEPYALWAIERQRGLLLPCAHEDIVLTDDLARHERLKLFLLNAGHTFLAERWLAEGREPDETVLDSMNDPASRAELESLWADEIFPVFEALGQRVPAEAYLVQLRQRLLNPFLEHRLRDIAQNHATKKDRRLAPILALATELHCEIPQRRLRAALATAVL
jgi:tagaturonate reductase